VSKKPNAAIRNRVVFWFCIGFEPLCTHRLTALARVSEDPVVDACYSLLHTPRLKEAQESSE
jgi:hypothetical protein